MASSSDLQGAGLNQNQLPASNLGGSSVNLQNQNNATALQNTTAGSVAVQGDKIASYKDTSYINLIILIIIAVAAVAGVLLWFRDAD